MKKGILFFSLSFLLGAAATIAQTITPSPNLEYCVGPNTLPYTITGTFNSGNVFTAYLSDSAGHFASELNIGQVTATTGGIISISISANPDYGPHYRIRVVSSNPIVSSDTTGKADIDVDGRLKIYIAASADTICKGTAVTIVAQNASSYLWSTGSTTDTVIVHPTTDSVFSVFGTGGICPADTSITISVYPTPIILNPTTGVCNGQGVLLVAPFSGSNYTWSPAEGLSATTGDSVVAAPTATTTYTVTGVDTFGCTLSGTEVVTSTTGPNRPTITTSETGDTLFSSAIKGNQWYRNDTLLAGDTASYLVITADRDSCYSDVVTSILNTCPSPPSFSTCSEGINKLILTNYLQVYPNPFNSELDIKINTAPGDLNGYNLQLTDILGRVIYKTPVVNYYTELDMTKIPPGVYFISVINGNSKAVKMVVKEN